MSHHQKHSFKKKLDVIQNTAICLGAMKTSSISVLQEMGEMPLELRQDQITVTYWINLQVQGINHLARRALTPTWEQRKSMQKYFAWCVRKKAGNMGITGNQFCLSVIIPPPPPLGSY